ncbi:MAG: hypothetical protein ACLFPU_10030, partial [Dehalococcoidia bacterium]
MPTLNEKQDKLAVRFTICQKYTGSPIYRTRYWTANKPRPTAKAAIQTALFHPKIFDPSNGPNGIRLKTANQVFIRAPSEKSAIGYTVFNRTNTTARQIFIAGPAIEINPAFSLVKVALPQASV